MSEQLNVQIDQVVLGRGVETGPDMMVVPSLSDATMTELYLRFSAAPESCRSREPVAVIVSTGVLNSPDHVAASGNRSDGNFTLELEIRTFDGPLAGNDPWICLVRMELGVLQPGTYFLIVRKTFLRFSDLGHPENATSFYTAEQRMNFTCI